MAAIPVLAALIAIVAVAVFLIVFGVRKLSRARRTGGGRGGGIAMIVVGAALIPIAVMAAGSAVWLVLGSERPAPAPVISVPAEPPR